MIKIVRKQKPEESIKIETPPRISDSNQVSFEQPVTAPPTLYLQAWVRQQNPETIKTEFNMTIRAKISELSPREGSILLMVCNVLALQDGIDMTLYLSLEYLYSFLTRSGSLQPEEIKEEKIRQSVLLCHLILQSFRGEWNGLGERIKIRDEEVTKAIVESNWLPSRRTFESWKTHWDPQKFLEIRIVPIDFLLERTGTSEPYSGYTKGYGEGGHSYTKKTRYSSELDGENYQETRPPEFNLLEVESYQKILTAIEANKARRIQEKR
jgi:hypothetical protein